MPRSNWQYREANGAARPGSTNGPESVVGTKGADKDLAEGAAGGTVEGEDAEDGEVDVDVDVEDECGDGDIAGGAEVIAEDSAGDSVEGVIDSATSELD